MLTPIAVYATVATIAVLHMIAPDHWVPLTLISDARKYPPRKKYALSTGIGSSHALLSIILAVAVLVGGTLIYSNFMAISTYLAASLLFIVALYFAIEGYRGENTGSGIHSSSLLASMVPDPAIVPFLLIAYADSSTELYVSIIIFTVATIASLIAVIFLASKGLKAAMEKVGPDKYDYLTAAILLLTGLFVLLSPNF